MNRERPSPPGGGVNCNNDDDDGDDGDDDDDDNYDKIRRRAQACLVEGLTIMIMRGCYSVISKLSHMF